MKRPNLLFFQVDQLSAASLRAYGDPVCLSPSIDFLAEQGVVFENAYCNFPLCAPSRFSMAAGQLCSTIGAYDNAAEFPAEIPTYAHYLRASGYQTYLSGKMHFIGPDQYHGFETRLTPDIYPADFSWVPSWGNEGKRDTNDPRSVSVSGVCSRSVQIDFDEDVAFQACRTLYDIARSSDDRPFFMQVSFTHPHEPYLCQPKHWKLYNHEEIPKPSVSDLAEEQHDAHSIRLLKDFGMLNASFSQEDIQRARHAYYGSISFIDEKIASVLSVLKTTGAENNTIVVFTSDHGDMLGERGMWFKKHFYEKSLRIPLFIYAPWLKAQRRKELVSLVDLLPTFNGLTHGQAWQDNVESLEGKDLTVFIDQPDASEDTVVHAEYLAEATTVPLFMIRRGSYKFVYSSKDPYLLFDLDKDPLELNNLAVEAEYHSVVHDFENEVRAKWNEEVLSEKILVSQNRRKMIRDSLKTGEEVRWNHNESAGEKVRWYRGVGGYNEWAFDFLPAEDVTSI